MSFAAGFPEPSLMSELTAKMLLEIEAVHFRAGKPYKLTLRPRQPRLHRLPAS